MSWTKWSTDKNHGKERTTSSGGDKKQEFLIGKKGEGYSGHVSVTTRANGSKFAMAGPHADKKKK